MKFKAIKRLPKTEFIPFLPNQEDPKELKSKFHTLFIEEHQAEKLDVEDENGEIIPGIFMEGDAYKIYKFYVGEFMEEENELHPIFNTISKNGFDDLLEFHIDSNGGSVSEGKLFFNIINNFQKENVAAFLNTGYSMGAILFCMPDFRIIHEFSDLMFHDYSTFMYGKAGDLETSHKHNSSHLRNFFKRFTLDKGFMSQEEFEQMLIGKEFWMDAKEMCERGIATHVKTSQGTITAVEYLESLNPKPETPKAKKPRTPRASKELKELLDLESLPENPPKTPRKNKEA